MTLHNVLILPTIVVLSISVQKTAAQDYRYAVFELSGLSELNQSDAPGGIDSVGDVVGGAAVGASDFHATLWPRVGGVIDLGTLGGDDSGAAAINELGAIAGWAGFRPNSSIYVRRACIWHDGNIFDLGTLGGESSFANAMNDLGKVVGESEFELKSFRNKAFIWQNGKMQVLPAPHPDWDGRAAFDINNLGEIVGYGYSVDGQLTGLLWRNGEVFDLGSLGGQGSTHAYAINESSVIVGNSRTRAEEEHAVKWVNGQIFDIHTSSAGAESVARGLNDRGQIVGENNSANVAMILNPGEDWIILNDVVPPRLRLDWNISNARTINDAGQIPVTANIGFDLWALLLTPVNPTMTLQNPLPGSAGTTNRLRVTGATPGSRVYFLYSRHGGGTRIPGCDLQQNALQLDSPTVIGAAVADANGVASITRTVPLIARGQTILFQAVVQGECAVSQLVVWRFE